MSAELMRKSECGRTLRFLYLPDHQLYILMHRRNAEGDYCLLLGGHRTYNRVPRRVAYGEQNETTCQGRTWMPLMSAILAKGVSYDREARLSQPRHRRLYKSGRHARMLSGVAVEASVAEAHP
jgi:hypothetical protein